MVWNELNINALKELNINAEKKLIQQHLFFSLWDIMLILLNLNFYVPINLGVAPQNSFNKEF